MDNDDQKVVSDKGERKPIIIRNSLDLQRLKLEKLMANPDKPVIIPEKPKERGVPVVPDFVRNVMGSSAGAGSGEFHVYRHLRRKEYARQKYMKEKAEREKLNDEYHNKLEENKRKAEERTAKKRQKRLKKKKKPKGNMKKLKLNQETAHSEISSEDSNEDTGNDTEDSQKEEKSGKPEIEINELKEKNVGEQIERNFKEENKAKQDSELSNTITNSEVAYSRSNSESDSSLIKATCDNKNNE